MIHLGLPNPPAKATCDRRWEAVDEPLKIDDYLFDPSNWDCWDCDPIGFFPIHEAACLRKRHRHSLVTK
jgi:hypothetical protein